MSKQPIAPKNPDPFDPSKTLNPFDPLKNLSTEKLIEKPENWSALKTAMEQGAKDYLTKRDKKEISGLGHGKDGLYRAQNLQHFLSADYQADLDKTKFFAMLYAVFVPNPGWFEHRSSALAMCIANQLIQGDFSCFSSDINPEKNPTTEYSLKSTAFSEKALRASTSDYASSLSVFATETVSTTQYYKTGAVRSFLQHARNNMPESERKNFDSEAASYKRALIQQPDQEEKEMQLRNTSLKL